MPHHTHHYSSSSGSSRSSSSSSSAAALARELGGLSINQKKAPTYETSPTSRLDSRYSEPKRSSQHTTARHESSLITPDTSRSRTKSNYGEPVLRQGERKVCSDERRSKTSDSRYHTNSFLDGGATYSTSSKREDSRFYPNSSYYKERR